MERDDAGGRVGGVDREGASQDESRVVARPHMDELASPRSGGKLRRMERLDPLTGQNLPAFDQLSRDEAHRHRRSSPSSPVTSSTSSTSSLPSSAASPSSTSPASPSGPARLGKASARASARSPKTSVGS